MPRRRRSGFAAFLDDFSPTKLLFHPATLFLLLNAFMAMTAVYFWNRYQHKIIDPATTLLTAEKIQINTPPLWTKTDLKAAILSSSDQPKSLLDPQLISDAVATCNSVGWIEQVKHMEKSREGLKVDLIYRQPIALVELGERTVPGWKQKPRFVPVDRQGVVMPDSLAMNGNAQPKIYIFHSDKNQRRAPSHLGKIRSWTPWPDSRVRDAAAISELLFSNWQGSGLSRIISWRQFENVEKNATIPFELWTDEGPNGATVVIWGSAPGQELNGEAPWDQKATALAAYIESNGPLTRLNGRIIDLRSGEPVNVKQETDLGYRNATNTDSFEVR